MVNIGYIEVGLRSVFVPSVYCSTFTWEKMKAQGAPWIHMHPLEARRSSVVTRLARAGSVFALSNSCDPPPEPAHHNHNPARTSHNPWHQLGTTRLHLPHGTTPRCTTRARMIVFLANQCASHASVLPPPRRSQLTRDVPPDPLGGMTPAGRERYTVTPHGNPVPSESCDGRRGLPPYSHPSPPTLASHPSPPTA